MLEVEEKVEYCGIIGREESRRPEGIRDSPLQGVVSEVVFKNGDCQELGDRGNGEVF